MAERIPDDDDDDDEDDDDGSDVPRDSDAEPNQEWDDVTEDLDV
jgi:hypothetical protein